MNYIGLIVEVFVANAMRYVAKIGLPMVVPHEIFATVWMQVLLVVVFTTLELLVYCSIARVKFSTGPFVAALVVTLALRALTYTDSIGGVIAMFAYNYPATGIVVTTVFTIIVVATFAIVSRVGVRTAHA